MATDGRPEAVLELTTQSRLRDLELIALNPIGRRQNKKYRPTVREPALQSAWLNEWETEKRPKPSTKLRNEKEVCRETILSVFISGLRRHSIATALCKTRSESSFPIGLQFQAPSCLCTKSI